MGLTPALESHRLRLLTVNSLVLWLLTTQAEWSSTVPERAVLPGLQELTSYGSCSQDAWVPSGTISLSHTKPKCEDQESNLQVVLRVTLRQQSCQQLKVLPESHSEALWFFIEPSSKQRVQIDEAWSLFPRCP